MNACVPVFEVRTILLIRIVTGFGSDLGRALSDTRSSGLTPLISLDITEVAPSASSGQASDKRCRHSAHPPLNHTEHTALGSSDHLETHLILAIFGQPYTLFSSI